MTKTYNCDYCRRIFGDETECRLHEMGHLDKNGQIKYDIIHIQKKDVCDFCEHSYYVYGCERDCGIKDCGYENCFKHFVPCEPLHDKSRNGV